MISSNRILFPCFHMLLLLVGVSAWTFPLKKAPQQSQNKLHYRNGITDESQIIQLISTTNVGSQSLRENVVSPPPPAAAAAAAVDIIIPSKQDDEQDDDDDDSVVVRQMDLPKKKYSPSSKNITVMKQTEMLLDFELVIGRIAMIASLLFFGGEIFYGISMTTMLSGSIGGVAF